MTRETTSTKVIAICGSASGVGKSPLVERLGQLVPDSVTMFFDAYAAEFKA